MPYFENPNITDMTGALEYTNTVTDGLTGMLLIFLVFTGVTLTIPGEFSNKIFGGTFTAAIVSMLFFLMGLVSESIMVICVIAAAGSMVFVLMER